jgi:hypothetical protein
VHNHLGNEAKEKVLDEAEGEARLRPVVAPFEDLQHVAIDLHLAVEVLLLERLDGNELLAVVSIAVLGLVELQVVLDGLAGQLSLFILAGRDLGGDPPEGPENGQAQHESKEDPRLEAHAPAPGDVRRQADKQRNKEVVVEGIAAGAFCGQRRIGNGRILLLTIYQFAAASSRRSMAGGALVLKLLRTHRSSLDAAIELGRRG